MTKTLVNHCLCAGLGVILGLSVGTFYWKANDGVHPLATSTTHVTSTPEETTVEADSPESVTTSDSWGLLQTAFLSVHALETADYVTLASMVHKEKGVRFTPFSTVNLENDLILTYEKIKNLETSKDTHSWGISPTTGSAILLPISSYFEQYVCPLSYSKAPYIAIDSVLISGNALENTSDAYPDCRFVDFTYRSIDPDLSGLDWSSLKLVFEFCDDAWYLVGVVHSVWTL